MRPALLANEAPSSNVTRSRTALSPNLGRKWALKREGLMNDLGSDGVELPKWCQWKMVTE